jgi:hypothetical protein
MNIRFFTIGFIGEIHPFKGLLAKGYFEKLCRQGHNKRDM